jgi:hypothetical protein
LDIVRCGSTTSGDRVPFTAFAFTGFAMAVDFFLVALIFIRGLEMFTSLLGTLDPVRPDLRVHLRDRFVGREPSGSARLRD